VQSPQNSDLANAWNAGSTNISPVFSMGNNRSLEDHFERSMTRNVTGDQSREKFLDGRNGSSHKGTILDKRVNSQKNTGRKNRDTKVTEKRILGAAGTAPIVGTPTLRRSF
jgi:hypothetical protein